MRSPRKPFPGLPASIAAVHRGRPDRPDLHAFAWELCPRLPGKPRTSANLKEEGACSRLNPLEDVILTDPWLAMNTEHAVNVLFAETDKAISDERVAVLRAAGLPLKWRVSGGRGAHFGIILDAPPVTGIRTAEEDKAMLRLTSMVHSYFITAIDGDRSAGLRGMTKNPFHPRWQTEVYDAKPTGLKDILEVLQRLAEAEGWVAPKRRYRGDRKREPSPEGRNCALFDLIRWWAGDEAEKDGSAILAKAQEVNDSFANPLGYGEVASVARSITRFMTTRFDGRGQYRPVSHEELNRRQVSAGRATAAARAASRDGNLHAAVARIRARGDEPGQEAVAAEAAVSLRTVKRAWSEIFRFVNKVPLAPPPSGSSAVDAPDADPAPPVQVPEAPVSDSRPSNIIRLSDLPAGSQTPEPVDWSPEGVKRRLRRASRRRCEEREAAHRAAARGGVRAYRDWVAARYAALFRERKADIERAEEWPEPDADVDPVAVWAARERLADSVRISRMGWAAKMKAEDKQNRIWNDVLMATESGNRPKPKFRTEADAMDRVATMVPGSQEQMNIARITSKREIRREQGYTRF